MKDKIILRWLITLTACTLLLIAVQARGADEWSDHDIQREVACVSLNAAYIIPI